MHEVGGFLFVLAWHLAAGAVSAVPGVLQLRKGKIARGIVVLTFSTLPILLWIVFEGAAMLQALSFPPDSGRRMIYGGVGPVTIVFTMGWALSAVGLAAIVWIAGRLLNPSWHAWNKR